MERLRAVLELLKAQGLSASRVRVGSIEVQVQATGEAPEKGPTLEDLQRKAFQEFQATMYGASEGSDYPIGGS